MGILMQAAGAYSTMRGAKIAAQGDVLAGQAASEADVFNAGVAATNAKIYNQAAVFAGQAGEAQAGNAGMKTREALGGIKAGQAASGVDVNTGSAVDVRASEASKGMLDALTIKANAAKEAYGLQTSARSAGAESALDTARAGYDIQAAKLKAKGTILGAQTQVGTSFGNYLLQNSLLPTSGTSLLEGVGEGTNKAGFGNAAYSLLDSVG